MADKVPYSAQNARDKGWKDPQAGTMAGIARAFGGGNKPNEGTSPNQETINRLAGLLDTLDKAKPGSLDAAKLKELNPYTYLDPSQLDAALKTMLSQYPATAKKAYATLAKHGIQAPVDAVSGAAPTILGSSGNPTPQVTSPAMTILGGRR
jgi:hypothetical protein